MQAPNEQLSDGELAEAVLAGDTGCFARIVQRHEKALQRTAFSRLGDAAACEEVVQETFLCAFKSLRTYDSTYSFRTWLWTILLNQCRRYLQKRSRYPRVNSWTDQSDDSSSPSAWQDDLSSPEAGPPSQLMEKERQQQLEVLLRKLPELQADAIRLRFFGGLKFQEIADVMNCSLSSAKNRVRWGLEKMSEMMVANTGDAMEPIAPYRSEL